MTRRNRLRGALVLIRISMLPLVLITADPVALIASEGYEMVREEMIETQIVSRGVADLKVLDAIRKVPRHLFVPSELKSQAYEDRPLPIGHSATISQPYIVAFMTELLEIEHDDRVLEIGTGSGYQAAVLAEIADKVFTVEIVESLWQQARQRLQELGYTNIETRYGDGWQGWPDQAPFDRIIVTAAAEHIPSALIDQLNEGGKIVIPVEDNKDHQQLIVGVKRGGILEKISTIPVRFVPLVRQNQLKK